MVRRTLVLAAMIIAIGVVGASAQREEVSKTEYFNALWKAMESTEGYFPRRVTVLRDEFGRTVIRERVTQVREYLKLDVFHHTVEKTNRGKKTISSFIKIGDNHYCKFGPSPWKKSVSSCEPMRLGSRPTPDSEQYWVQELSGNSAGERHFGMRQVHKSPNSPKGIEYFIEQRFLVNPKGLLTLIDIKEGTSGQLNAHQVERYEYNVSISEIKAPIK